MRAKIKGITSIDQDLADIDSLISQTHGPDRYVLGGMKSLISALYRLEEETNFSTMQMSTSFFTLTQTIRELDEKNSRLQMIGIILAVIGTLFTVLQVVQVIDILRQWFGWW